MVAKHHNSDLIYNNNVSIQVCKSLKRKKGGRISLAANGILFCRCKDIDPLRGKSRWCGCFSRYFSFVSEKKSFLLNRKIFSVSKKLKIEIFSRDNEAMTIFY